MSRAEKKLDRQIKAYLEDLCLEGQAFDDFFSSIVRTYEQYEDKNKLALRNLELSSKEQNDLNIQLRILNNSMAAILDNLGPALLFFGKNGACSSVYSKSCLEILKKDPAERNIWDVFELDNAQKGRFRDLIEFIFSNNSAMGFDDLFKMAPSKVETPDQYLTIKYKPIYGGRKNLENILVIVSDETEVLRTRNLLRERQDRVGRLVRMVKYRDDYINLISDIYGYFLDSGGVPKYRVNNDLDEIKGHIHTLKGLAGSFRMDHLAAIFHSCEDHISRPEINVQHAQNYISSQLEIISEAYDAEIYDAKSILGDDFLQHEGMLRVGYDSLNAFYDVLKEKDIDLAGRFKKSFLEISLFETLTRLDVHREHAAVREGKKVKPCVVKGKDIKIPYRRHNALIQSFVHIIRNSVYHGIESPELRKKKGKSPFGVITIDVSSSVEKGNVIAELIFSDDGAGFNVDYIRNKLTQKGHDVSSMSEEQIINSVFDQGMSSSEEVTQFSGRGVGLSEVRHQVKAVDGDIRALVSDEGSKIVVRFPINEAP